jgi:2-polyprenyl-3-methyl-5-hydroxy-6-metoxy-1,4-benzoquinol methylase
MYQFKNCLICDANDLIPIKGYEKDHLCKCKKCSFVFASKIPTHEELLEEYAKYGRSNIISPITMKRFSDLLKSFEKYKVSNNIIDVGAGDGHFIGLAKQTGWNAFATEFDNASVQLCQEKEVMVHKGKLNSDNYADNYFDIIYSSEVIEHINNPLEEINNFRKILRTGGLVYVTTPNYNSISHKILKNKWNVFNYPEHLCYYTPKTLAKLFLDNGFKKVSVETTGFSPSRYFKSTKSNPLEVSNNLNNNNDELLREKMETKWMWKIIKNTINGFLNFFKIGDAMKGTFIKVN